MVFKHQDGLKFLEEIPDNSVDLILTDPPYITSRDSGMDKWVGHVAKQDSEEAENIKSEEDWAEHIAYSEMEALVLFSLICGR
jgi:DNA modification methylase